MKRKWNIGKNKNKKSKRYPNPAISKLTTLFQFKMNGKKALSQEVKRKDSIGNKLFLSMVLTVLISVIVVGIFSYMIAKSILEEQVKHASEQTIQQAGKNLDFILTNTDRQITDFAANVDMRTLLEQYEKADVNDDFTMYRALRDIEDRLKAMNITNSNYNFYILSGTHHTVATNVDYRDKELLFEEDWYKEIKEERKQLWIGGKENGITGTETSPTLSVGRFLPIGKQGYIIVVEVKEALLAETLQEITFGESEKVKLVDANNVIQFSFEENEIGSENRYEFDKKTDETSYVHHNGDNLVFVHHSSDSNWYLAGQVKISELTKDMNKIAYLILIVVVICALIASFIGRRIVTFVGVPLKEIGSLMKQASEGDLRVRAQMDMRKDEIGLLGKNFNEMVDSISLLVQNTTETANHVLDAAAELSEVSTTTAAAAKEVAIATDEIAQGAQGLTGQAEIGNGLTTKMGTEIQNVIEKNSQMNDYVMTVQQSSDDGIQKMNHLVAKTKRGEELTTMIVRKVNGLKESTTKINEVMEILQSISKQTNLLSLNAAIEAARAGQVGKGFAVVAQEIRNLSNESQTSIETVGNITSAIVRDVEQTVEVLLEAEPIFKEQVDTAQETDELLSAVGIHMKDVIRKIEEVSESTKQLTSSQCNLADSIMQVSSTAQQSAAITEEVSASTHQQLSISDRLVTTSDELKQLSTKLQDALSKFTIK
ncbi:methyl-accepting chemotaxis protein [Alkalihalobacterium bogoriense]|uniref:methyl-accepting chemotaxis protein n=1 Tax=Alkalihalobacterium bogoriense TaxID=246272 RepID=UPI00047A218A|nr:methyl-accepting chemotaxis protein [Alkalihalobacterium bogoriense]